MIGHIPLPNPIPSLLSNLRKILVVEDNLINQKVVCRILERLYGRCLFPVDNGEDAISQIFSEHQSISLIFMDSDMPYLNGLETTRLIRQYERENYLPKVPIVGMIFHATLGFRDSCLEAGMDDTLHKPLGRQNLVQMVEKHVLNKQESSSSPTGKQTA
ncbi:CheY-like superfamily [Flagelloscypha sp. PMI_526]|nr:CheY-like superfamily [Flagelloscypha sp. PMI_526]